MKDLDLFLQESNNIEDVWDDQSFKQAKKAWNYLIKQDKLTPENICKAHGILMKYHLPKDEAGHFRKQPVWIGGHQAKPWYIVPELMKYLCEQANKPRTENEIKEDHIKFEQCHGYLDGNGRVYRLVLNWERVKNNFPILVIYNDKKWDYYEWFN